MQSVQAAKLQNYLRTGATGGVIGGSTGGVRRRVRRRSGLLAACQADWREQTGISEKQAGISEKQGGFSEKQGGFSEKQGPTLILRGRTLFFREWGYGPIGCRAAHLQAGHFMSRQARSVMMLRFFCPVRRHVSQYLVITLHTGRGR